MFPYFFLIFIPLLFVQQRTASKKRVHAVGEEEPRMENGILPAFFFLFLLLLVLRHQTIGRDLPNYCLIFSRWGNKSFSSVFSDANEWLFHLYNWIVYNFISTDYQLYLAITAALTVIPIAFVYNRNKRHGYLQLILFVNMSTFTMLFSGIRQGLAMAAGILAYQAVSEKKTWKYIFWSLAAVFIHHTGFVSFLFLPLFRIRFKSKDLYWIVPAVGVLALNAKRVFEFLTGILGAYDEQYLASAEETGAWTSFILYAMFSLFFFLLADERKMDEEAFGLRNILAFATAMQIFASVHALAMRMNYYFILLIPAAVGKCMDCIQEKNKSTGEIAEIVICLFFTVYFVVTTYRSFVSGQSALDTVPYLFFWQG